MARVWLAAISVSLTAVVLLGMAQTSAREVRFEVLSIKPMRPGTNIYTGGTGLTDPSLNGFVSRLSILQMILLAYASADYKTWGGVQVRNLPSWDGRFYDINARVAGTDLKAWQHQSRQRELLRAAMRTALKERCKLVLHEEPSTADAFELVIGKQGPKLPAADPRFKDPAFKPPVSRALTGGGFILPEMVKDRQVRHFFGQLWMILQNSWCLFH